MPYLMVWVAINFAVGFVASEPRNGFLMNSMRGYLAMLLLNVMALAVMGDYCIYLSMHPLG